MLSFVLSSHEKQPTLTDIAIPECASGQIRVKIRACGLNFADLLMVEGKYQDTPPLPFTLGMEVPARSTRWATA